MAGEERKNNSFFDELKETIERNRIKSLNWIQYRIKEVNKIFTECLFNINKKLYSF